MNNEINLIPGKAKQTSSLVKKRILLHRIAIGSMFLVSFLSIVLFILIAFSPLPSLQQREKDESKRLTFYNDMIVKLHMTKNRLNQIEQIINTRPTYTNILNSIFVLMPDRTSIGEVRLNDKTLTVTIVSPSLLPLEEFVNEISAKISTLKSVKKITLVSLKKDFEAGTYILTLELI